MRISSKLRLWTMLSCVLVLSLLITVSSYASQTYTNGYFRYTVQDNSVTITEYFGTDAVVQVPNMIAGDPVNVIGGGAFAGNKNVRTVYLPDTIMNVAQGAFSAGQSAIYSSSQGTEEKPEETVVPAGNVAGFFEEDGSFITVDNEHNLISVDVNGNETVLDEGQDYTVTAEEDGTVRILDPSGQNVDVADLTNGYDVGEVEFTEVQTEEKTEAVKQAEETKPEEELTKEEPTEEAATEIEITEEEPTETIAVREEVTEELQTESKQAEEAPTELKQAEEEQTEEDQTENKPAEEQKPGSWTVIAPVLLLVLGYVLIRRKGQKQGK